MWVPGSGGGGATVSLLQDACSINASASSRSVTLPNAPTGSLIAVELCESTASNPVSSISQTGVTWTRLGFTTAGGQGFDVWRGSITGTPGTGITVSRSTVQWGQTFVLELSPHPTILVNARSSVSSSLLYSGLSSTVVSLVLYSSGGTGNSLANNGVSAPILATLWGGSAGNRWVTVAKGPVQRVDVSIQGSSPAFAVISLM